MVFILSTTSYLHIIMPPNKAPLPRHSLTLGGAGAGSSTCIPSPLRGSGRTAGHVRSAQCRLVGFPTLRRSLIRDRRDGRSHSLCFQDRWSQWTAPSPYLSAKLSKYWFQGIPLQMKWEVKGGQEAVNKKTNQTESSSTRLLWGYFDYSANRLMSDHTEQH